MKYFFKKGASFIEILVGVAKVEQDLTTAKTTDLNASANKKQVDAQAVQQTADAIIKEILSRVEQNLAIAKSAADKNQLENLKVFLSTVKEKKPNGSGNRTAGKA